MQLGFIPPRGMEELALASTYHLTLAHVTHTAYLRIYGIAKTRGHFITMDNGVAEGILMDTKELLVRARRLGAQELVLPDVLGDTAGTQLRVMEFLAESKRMPPAVKYDCAYMGVAQGNNMHKVRDLISWYAPQMQIKSIGIPRIMMTDSNLGVRIDLANWIEETFPGRFEIHLLGANAAWPREIRSVVRYAPHVRSMDSSMAFAYAMKGENLSAKHLSKITRPPMYFDIHVDDCIDLARSNIRTMIGWLNVEAPTG